MQRTIICLLVALSFAPAPGASESSCRLDGITIGQPSSQLRWLDNTKGKFKHVKTTVEVKNGEVVTIWGERLMTPTDIPIQLGQSGQVLPRWLTVAKCTQEEKVPNFLHRYGTNCNCLSFKPCRMT